MYKYIMLILISRWLMNLICSMKKLLNVQNSFKENSQPPTPPFSAIWKTLLQLSLILLFIFSLFHFKFYTFLLTLLQLWFYSLCVCMVFTTEGLFEVAMAWVGFEPTTTQFRSDALMLKLSYILILIYIYIHIYIYIYIYIYIWYYRYLIDKDIVKIHTHTHIYIYMYIYIYK